MVKTDTFRLFKTFSKSTLAKKVDFFIAKKGEKL